MPKSLKDYEPPVIHNYVVNPTVSPQWDWWLFLTVRTHFKAGLSRVAERLLRVLQSAAAGTVATCPVASGKWPGNK